MTDQPPFLMLWGRDPGLSIGWEPEDVASFLEVPTGWSWKACWQRDGQGRAHTGVAQDQGQGAAQCHQQKPSLPSIQGKQ